MNLMNENCGAMIILLATVKKKICFELKMFSAVSFPIFEILYLLRSTPHFDQPAAGSARKLHDVSVCVCGSLRTT